MFRFLTLQFNKPLTKANKWLLVLNLCCVVVTLLAMLAPLVSAQLWVIPALLNIVFLYLYIANAVFVLLWLLQLHWLSSVSMLVLIVGFAGVKNCIVANITAVTPSYVGAKLRIMSYNVKVFDLYNWSHNTETRVEILNTLLENKADIINIQEFYTSTIPPHRNHDSIMTATGYYANLQITKVANTKDYFGIVTYSRYPIVNTGIVEFEKNGNNIALYTDVVLNSKDTLRVYNCHLQSVHLKKTDFLFLSQLKNGSADTNYDKSISSIYSRLALAYNKRVTQVELLAKSISESPYKVLLTGDLNDVPNSYTYGKLMNTGLQDAFLEQGFGFGKTFTGTALPLRIDYILHSKQLNCTTFDVLHTQGSDHYAIVAEVRL